MYTVQSVDSSVSGRTQREYRGSTSPRELPAHLPKPQPGDVYIDTQSKSVYYFSLGAWTPWSGVSPNVVHPHHPTHFLAQERRVFGWHHLSGFARFRDQESKSVSDLVGVMLAGTRAL